MKNNYTNGKDFEAIKKPYIKSIVPDYVEVYEETEINILLNKFGISMSDIFSKNMRPDSLVYNPKSKEITVIEMKYQNSNGSVDEKLQTCVFKKWQYLRLFESVDCEIKYWYLANEWYFKDEYKDLRRFIYMNGCRIFNETINPEHFV